jgi:2-methylcitrate dehydratase PrpD
MAGPICHEENAVSDDSAEVTRTLARWLVASRREDIAAPVRQEGARSLLNWVGCTVGGSRHEAVDHALAALKPFAGPEQASLLGRHERIDILNASLLNGIASHVFDFDDTHLRTIIHPAGPIASAILALGEHRAIGGADFLHAFILGIEVECRIGNAVYPAHYDIGWHITGTAGVFGAAAACAKLLGLDEQGMIWALGIAGTQSSGFREMFGTMCKPFHPGRAAQNGLTASLLAAQGFTSSNRVLEAPRGFAHVMSTARDFTEITRDLGGHYEVSVNSYKPFACGIVIHPAIDGCIQLRTEHKLSGDEIAKIELKTHPLVLELTGKKTPQVGLEGKFSVYHSCAVAIIHGAAGEREYSDEAVRDPRVIALRDRVTAIADKGVHEDAVFVTVTLNDGSVLTRHVAHAIGSVERPMSDADLDRKFHGLTDGILTRTDSDCLLGLCRAVETLPRIAQLCEAARPAVG